MGSLSLLQGIFPTQGSNPGLLHFRRILYQPSHRGSPRILDGWMASLTRWTWVWVNSGSWWWTGRPGVLWFMGSQRVGHDWATELNWTPHSPGEGNGNPLQHSWLESPMDRGNWKAIVHGVTRVRHDLATKPPPALQADSLPTELSGRPWWAFICGIFTLWLTLMSVCNANCLPRKDDLQTGQFHPEW